MTTGLPVKTNAAILLLSQGGAHSASIAYIAGKVTPWKIESDHHNLLKSNVISCERRLVESAKRPRKRPQFYLSQSHQHTTEDQQGVASPCSQRSQQGEDGRAENAVSQQLSPSEDFGKSSSRYLC